MKCVGVPGWLALVLGLLANGQPACSQANTPETNETADAAFFVEQLYPIMQQVQCNLCHSDNGVASDTSLEFPSATANPARISAFGLKLLDLIDAQDPADSLLLRMPTNRDEHTGGERIKQGSPEEQILITWIEYLAQLNDRQLEHARQQIAEAERVALQPLTVRRLTHSQYNHTVRDLLHDRSRPANGFPKEDFVRGFRNQAEAQGISPLQAEAYAKAAERLATGALRGGDMHGLIPCQPNAPTDRPCAEQFIRQFGSRAFRRPLTDHELHVYGELFVQEAGRQGDFVSGASMVIETMLQSPHFLFRIERGAEGPLAAYEIASRLSFFLWDTMPTDEMLAAAARGEYLQAGEIEATARRMLDDPRAKPAMEEFLGQWLRFDAVLSATRDRRKFGVFSEEVANAMVQETRLLFNHLVWQDQNFMEFFTADYTFVNAQLAELYQLPLPASDYELVRYPADSGRSGILGHGSFLVATSKPAETSPTERGLFVRNHFLGHEVPPPPPGVNTALPEIADDMPMTNRQRLGIHLNSEACASCHRLIDPIGFGFEQYDAIGRFSAYSASTEAGSEGPETPSTTKPMAIDTTAYIQGIENSEFSTPKELGRILAENDACQRAIVKQLFRFCFGREETASDQASIDVMLEKFRASGFQFRELIVAMVTSESFAQSAATAP